jgi:hypothetical protein
MDWKDKLTVLQAWIRLRHKRIFEEATQKFEAENTDIFVMQLESPDGMSLLTALVKTDADHQSVYWPFDPHEALAYAEPNLSSDNTRLNEAPFSKGLKVGFAYNPGDKHWYAYGVDNNGVAREWFNTYEATIDNLAEHMTAIVAFPGEWQAKINHVETLADGRKVAIEKSTIEGKPSVKRVLQYDNSKKEWIP